MNGINKKMRGIIFNNLTSYQVWYHLVLSISFVVINKTYNTYVLFMGDYHHASDRTKTDINFHVSFQYMGNLVLYFSDLWSYNILVLTFGFSPGQRSCD